MQTLTRSSIWEFKIITIGILGINRLSDFWNSIWLCLKCIARPSKRTLRLQRTQHFVRPIQIMATLEEVTIDDEIDQEILNSSTDDIINRTRLLENTIK